MKNNYIAILILASFAAMAACTKSKDFIEDNTTSTGVGSRPVSTNPLRIVTATPVVDLNNAKFAAGATFKTELQYFSESPVKEVNFYTTVGTGARTKVATFPYASSFSKIKRADTLLVPYTVPAAPVNTSIKLDYEILNQNNLSLVRTATIKL